MDESPSLNCPGVDDCPPADAGLAAGEYFHLCTTNPISHDRGTLRTARERDLHEGDPDKACQRCGISVFPNAAAARLLREIMLVTLPRVAAKWRYVARATLVPQHGWVKVTGGTVESHTTWWPATSVIDRCALFNDVEEV